NGRTSFSLLPSRRTAYTPFGSFLAGFWGSSWQGTRPTMVTRLKAASSQRDWHIEKLLCRGRSLPNRREVIRISLSSLSPQKRISRKAAKAQSRKGAKPQRRKGAKRGAKKSRKWY